MELFNKVAVVTGAAGGIGKAIINQLLEQGVKVLAVDLSEKSLKSTKVLMKNNCTLSRLMFLITDKSKPQLKLLQHISVAWTS